MKKTISFIEAINPKDHALQTAIRAFSIIRFGGTLTSEEAKLFIELCSLALPMRYRFPRHVHEAMEKQVKESLGNYPSRRTTMTLQAGQGVGSPLPTVTTGVNDRNIEHQPNGQSGGWGTGFTFTNPPPVAPPATTAAAERKVRILESNLRDINTLYFQALDGWNAAEDWWHKEWHRATGVPCDGSSEYCPLIRRVSK